MTTEGNDMERRVTEHDEIIHKNILPRVEALESFAAGFTEKVTVLNNDVVRVQTGQAELGRGQKELEMTVKVEGEKSRQAMVDANETTKETKAIANKLLDHVLFQGKEKQKTDAEIRKTKWEWAGKIAFALISGGSILYVVIDNLTK